VQLGQLSHAQDDNVIDGNCLPLLGQLLKHGYYKSHGTVRYREGDAVHVHDVRHCHTSLKKIGEVTTCNYDNQIKKG
jgi:hypothetical protein